MSVSAARRLLRVALFIGVLCCAAAFAGVARAALPSAPDATATDPVAATTNVAATV